MQTLLDTNTFLLVLAAFLAFAFGWIVYLEIRFSRLTRGKSGADLEDTIAALVNSERSFQEFKKSSEVLFAHIEKRMRSALRAVGMVRFTAFGQSEGGQSFASAFLSEDGDGVVISTLNARGRTGVFGKQLTNNVSSIELTDEERAAIEAARKELG